MAQPSTIKSGDPRNDVSPSAPKGYSKFNLSHRFLQTHRFGEITPHCSFEVVKGDISSMRLMNDTSSYSLKAPIKTDMFQKRSNFFVPLQAILYNNWELFVTQPVSGDDVPEEVDGVVNAIDLNSFFGSLVSNLTVPISSGNSDAAWMTLYLRNLLVAEMFFSQGSLCKQLGIDFCHCFRSYKAAGTELVPYTFDSFIESVLDKFAPKSSISNGITGFEVEWYDEQMNVTDHYYVWPSERLNENPAFDDPSQSTPAISFRHFLDLARQNLNFNIVNRTKVGTTDDAYWFTDFWFDPNAPQSGTSKVVNIQLFANLAKNINFDKVSAYQICCAHFFSLDYVDYIYSAQLYRQLMNYYNIQLLGGTPDTFTWNGLELEFDALSGHYITGSLIAPTSPNNPISSTFSYSMAYLTALFSFRHSLRYLDYFTGGRTNPLSVGTSGDQRADVSVAVNNNAVNGVEMILAQNAARYLNFAQRTGRKIAQWLDNLFPGGQPKPDMHDPQWLSTTGDALQPEQTQNTGAAQVSDANSITARFQNDSNRYMFKVMPDRPGYIICVTYYDVPRAYAFATDKENLHCNRYDRFNPFMQYDGSQSVDRQEIGLPGSAPFSYQNRYEEYKQLPDRCCGGFVENLPGFAFIADVQTGLPMQPNLNPSYVRSWNVELDPFYVSLTGYGLAAYFHFIVKNVNIIECQRPMEYKPQLM